MPTVCESCGKEIVEVTENNECPECGQEYLFNPLEQEKSVSREADNQEKEDSTNSSENLSGEKERVQTSVVTNNTEPENEETEEEEEIVWPPS